MTAQAVLQELNRQRATHLVGIPDNASAALFRALPRSGIRRLTVSREGEALAVAAGLWIGGARPVVSIQNTGLLESGDSLRGVAIRMGVPLLILVGYRGYSTMAPASLGPGTPYGRDELIRPDVDSAALMTEPTLRAWAVPYTVARPDGGIEAIAEAGRLARDSSAPAAVLLTSSLE